MKQNRSIYSKIKKYRFVPLVLIAGMVSLQVSAQHRNFEKREGKPQKDFSNNRGNEQRMQMPRRQQNPVVNNRSNDSWRHNADRQDQGIQRGQNQRQRGPIADNQPGNRWNHEGNRQEQRVEPRQNQFPQQANNNSRPRRFDNNNSSNNDRRFGNQRNHPRASHYDNYRFRPEYRRPVYSSRNPGWRYSYLPRRNAIIASFSFPFSTIYFGGYNYRYCDGVYYRPYNNVFQVVAPPIGIYINILPFGYSRIMVHDYPYYYYNGTYYDDYEDSYRVVAPPLGAIVESIPDGYETIVIDGETYYKVDDVQYKPVVQDNGEIWYEVIKVG